MPEKVYSVTLAAGSGNRMPDHMPPKSCCRIGPVTIIENALRSYEEAGITKHVVVVGCDATKVMKEIRRTGRQVLFAYQPEPRGTGDAVAQALELLHAEGSPDHILISSGDKMVAPRVLRGLVELYAESDCHMALVGGLARHNPTGGRIVAENGFARAILEWPDIRLRQLAAHLRSLPDTEKPGTGNEFRKLVRDFHDRPGKLAARRPKLQRLLEAEPQEQITPAEIAAALEDVPGDFQLPGGSLPAEQAANSELSNLSLYAGAFKDLWQAVRKLGAENVQGECYFTDVVENLVATGRKVRIFTVQDPEQVMAFNTAEELEAVRRVHALRTSEKTRYPDLQEWGKQFSKPEQDGLACRAARGLADKIDANRQAIVVRSPGRINLMGRHIDHQGGTCNLMAINREIALVASPREDDRINLWNAESTSYPRRSFSFEELTRDIIWEDWLKTLNSQFVQRMAAQNPGDWSNYIKGAALRLQHRFRERKLRGMDACICGNIPVGAGLSSSSALVVAAAEALCELNALNVQAKEFVDLCGEGEWFVGTRGGSGDHAAIKFGKEREVVSVKFFPFEVAARHPFPRDQRVMVCYSGISAKKTENARSRFNSRVACYHMGRELIRKQHPSLAPHVKHLRDLDPALLGISYPAFYQILRTLPQSVGWENAQRLAADSEDVSKCLEGLAPAENSFPVRDVVLFGLAECSRARMAGSLLDRGDLETFGELMKISHDGDRVMRWGEDQKEWCFSATDERLLNLEKKASKAQPLQDSNSALWQQPGGYRCSTSEIDQMVDIVLTSPGVIGAQLAGAGLGGCIMVLLERGAEEHVREVLVEKYYEPANIEPQLFVCEPSRGSRVLTTLQPVN
ncbi:MAG: galactokinase family protein [Candidatus Brocadiia bacterium]